VRASTDGGITTELPRAAARYGVHPQGDLRPDRLKAVRRLQALVADVAREHFSILAELMDAVDVRFWSNRDLPNCTQDVRLPGMAQAT
jgi:hypothetical protein